uniref:Uncharacterized protein n=1 Tax=Lepeophtheirus salmonis TaxID=72036 RepID=A0A0K2UQ37_LEPSM
MSGNFISQGNLRSSPYSIINKEGKIC